MNKTGVGVAERMEIVQERHGAEQCDDNWDRSLANRSPCADGWGVLIAISVKRALIWRPMPLLMNADRRFAIA